MASFIYPRKPPEPGTDGGVEDPDTLAVDYLYLHRHRLIDSKKAEGNYFYSRKNTVSGPVKVNYDSNAVYIAMPGNLQTSYGPAYRRMDLGGIGVSVAEMMGGGMNMTKLADKLQAAAKVALPEFSTATAMQMANSFNQYLGLGGSIDVNSLQQLNHGKIFNPFSEQIFAGVSFRTHNFAFKMLARDEKEAEEIFKIIEYIKEGSMPGISSGNFPSELVNKRKKYQRANQKQNKKGKKIDYKNLDIKRKSGNVFGKGPFKQLNKSSYGKSDRYMEVPDRFDIRFVRMNANKLRDSEVSGGTPKAVYTDREDLHFKIFPSICTGIQVNYTPDSTYIARKDIGNRQIDVPAVVVSCSFVETRLLTNEDVRNGY